MFRLNDAVRRYRAQHRSPTELRCVAATATALSPPSKPWALKRSATSTPILHRSSGRDIVAQQPAPLCFVVPMGIAKLRSLKAALHSLLRPRYAIHNS